MWLVVTGYLSPPIQQSSPQGLARAQVHFSTVGTSHGTQQYPPQTATRKSRPHQHSSRSTDGLYSPRKRTLMDPQRNNIRPDPTGPSLPVLRATRRNSPPTDNTLSGPNRSTRKAPTCKQQHIPRPISPPSKRMVEKNRPVVQPLQPRSSIPSLHTASVRLPNSHTQRIRGEVPVIGTRTLSGKILGLKIILPA